MKKFVYTSLLAALILAAGGLLSCTGPYTDPSYKDYHETSGGGGDTGGSPNTKTTFEGTWNGQMGSQIIFTGNTVTMRWLGMDLAKATFTYTDTTMTFTFVAVYQPDLYDAQVGQTSTGTYTLSGNQFTWDDEVYTR
jgi:hypothetical protein